MALAVGRPFLSAEWRHLVMLNYAIDPDMLVSRVPAGTELDSWNGKTFLSVVGFLFLHTRVLGIRFPFHHSFEEVNLRFYVRRKDSGGQWRRGVVFVKEIVPRLAVAMIARRLYNENYVALPMGHAIDPARGSFVYEWKCAGAWNQLKAQTMGEASPIREGSGEEFITEHYWGYSRQQDGGCVEYAVQHPRWRVWPVSHAELLCDVRSIYGSHFHECLSAEPTSAFVADGSAVTVSHGRRIV